MEREHVYIFVCNLIKKKFTAKLLATFIGTPSKDLI